MMTTAKTMMMTAKTMMMTAKTMMMTAKMTTAEKANRMTGKTMVTRGPTTMAAQTKWQCQHQQQWQQKQPMSVPTRMVIAA